MYISYVNSPPLYCSLDSCRVICTTHVKLAINKIVLIHVSFRMGTLLVSLGLNTNLPGKHSISCGVILLAGIRLEKAAPSRPCRRKDSKLVLVLCRSYQ